MADDTTIALQGPTTSAEASATAQQPSASAPPQPPKEQVYGAIPSMPTQQGPEGIRYDFNHGIRLYIPRESADKEPQLKYTVTFMDYETGVILFKGDVKDGDYITSIKKYYIPFRIIIQRYGSGETVFEHDFNMKDRDVLIQIPFGTIGDSFAWFSFVEPFQLKHGCHVICYMQPQFVELFRKQYPNITFIRKDETLQYTPYASYYLGLFFNDDVDNQPVDFRCCGLHQHAGYILGLRDKELADTPPRVDMSAPRRIREKYCCIATQATSQCKYWNNPNGWRQVVAFLKDSGYRVLCIDKEPVHGGGVVWNHMPWGCEDFTGALPLQDRIDLLKDCDFFVGLPSGLSWMAWQCRVPVVMISGFSAPYAEFYTPYRVINYYACNSCWNDRKLQFDHKDFLWCPRHSGDPRQFECSKLITAEQVIKVIKTIPGFSTTTVHEQPN